MTHEEARNAIMQRFLDEFEGEFPIALPNQPFTQPEPAAGVKWVRLDMRFASGGQETLGAAGGRKFLHGGTAVVQVYTPNGDATNDNDELAKRALNLLDSVRVSASLWTDGGRVVTVGTDGEWYQQNMIVNTHFEETR
jgi:hypothetical protein